MILPSGFSTFDYSITAASKGWSSGWPQCGGMAGNVVQVTAKRSGASIAGGVHRRIQVLAQTLIDQIEKQGYLLVPGWCWGAECRAISGTSTPSNHSWGLAMDLNAPNNPYTSSGQHDIPDWAYAIFRRYGFGLGADYSGRKDWMHTEFMGTPGDADIMTQLAVKEFGGGGGPVGGDDWTDTMNLADWTAVVREASTT